MTVQKTCRRIFPFSDRSFGEAKRIRATDLIHMQWLPDPGRAMENWPHLFGLPFKQYGILEPKARWLLTERRRYRDEVLYSQQQGAGAFGLHILQT